MASEPEGNCPVCQDTPEDVASALPCRHRFCLGCILRWVRRNPVCPLCRGRIQTIQLSGYGEGDYLEIAVTAPAELPDGSSLARTDPDGLSGNRPHPPVASHPFSAQGTLSPPGQGPSGIMFVGGVLPEVWADLFRGQQHLLDPVRLWLCQRLEGELRSCWWLVEAAESIIIHHLCVYGPNAEVLTEKLEPQFKQDTAPLIRGVISIIAAQCSEEAQRLLRSGAAMAEHSSPGPTASSRSSNSSTSHSSSSSTSSSRISDSGSISSGSSSSSSVEGIPISGPADPEVEAGAAPLQTTQCGGRSCPPPLPVPRERDQPQEEPEQVVTMAGPSTQGSSNSLVLTGDPCPTGHQLSLNKRAPSSQDCPQPCKRLPQ